MVSAGTPEGAVRHYASFLVPAFNLVKHLGQALNPLPSCLLNHISQRAVNNYHNNPLFIYIYIYLYSVLMFL